MSNIFKKGLTKANMKLNPKKCTFIVKWEKFLVYVVQEKGIEANLNKVEAILKMKSPEKHNEMQRGKL